MARGEFEVVGAVAVAEHNRRGLERLRVEIAAERRRGALGRFPPNASAAVAPVLVVVGVTKMRAELKAPQAKRRVERLHQTHDLCGNQALVSPDSKFARISLRCSGARPFHAAHKETAH